jgi:TolA-binding protein
MLAIAAVLVAAVALGVIYRNRQTTPAPGGSLASGPAPAPPPAVRQAGTWDVKKPALLLPLATALVVRGEAEEASRALGAALAPYRTDDYVAAERLLEAVVQKFPASADAWFYLGSTRLLDGDPAGAREALTEARARGVGDRDDEAAWLLATAEARTGELDQARTRLTTLCDGSGAFKTAACNAKGSLAQ